MQIDENVDRVKESVSKNRRISICEVANMFQTSFVSVRGILKDNLDISQTATKFVLRLMSKESKEKHVAMCRDIGESLERDKDFILKVITGDDT